MSGVEVPPNAGISLKGKFYEDHDFAMYILQARITLDRKDNHLDQSSETSNVFKQSSTHMPPQTGVTLAKYAFFSEAESLSKEILLHLSLIKPYLINSSIDIPYSPPHCQKSQGAIFLAALKDTNLAPRMRTTMANKPLRQVGAGDIASFLHIWWDPEFAST